MFHVESAIDSAHARSAPVVYLRVSPLPSDSQVIDVDECLPKDGLLSYLFEIYRF